MIDRKNCGMFLSGLKTAARLTIEKLGMLSDQDICDVAASFQKAVRNIIYKKTKYAINEYEKIVSGKTLVMAGGVASNEVLRSAIRLLAQECFLSFCCTANKIKYR